MVVEPLVEVLNLLDVVATVGTGGALGVGLVDLLPGVLDLVRVGSVGDREGQQVADVHLVGLEGVLQTEVTLNLVGQVDGLVVTVQTGSQHKGGVGTHEVAAVVGVRHTGGVLEHTTFL
eukprot:463306_1